MGDGKALWFVAPFNDLALPVQAGGAVVPAHGHARIVRQRVARDAEQSVEAPQVVGYLPRSESTPSVSSNPIWT
jgi:hypothetical protein